MIFKTNNQRKKDNDEAQNDTLSGDTKQKQGETEKNEQIPVDVDNHADNHSQDSSNVTSGVANEGSNIESNIHPDTF